MQNLSRFPDVDPSVLRSETGYVSPLPPVQDFVAVGDAELSVDDDVSVVFEVERLVVLEEPVDSEVGLDDDDLFVELALWVLEVADVGAGVLLEL
jgi:hypothetical protein